jgi:hypothetical protein
MLRERERVAAGLQYPIRLYGVVLYKYWEGFYLLTEMRIDEIRGDMWTGPILLGIGISGRDEPLAFVNQEEFLPI